MALNLDREVVNFVSMMPRNAGLSDSCTSDRGFFSSLRETFIPNKFTKELRHENGGSLITNLDYYLTY